MFIISILLFVGTMAISLYAMARLKSTYHHYLGITTRSGLTGAEVAQRILDAADISDVDVVAGEGMLGDHYDPMNKRLVLSPDNYHGTSIAALGVAAHECGHAVQHKIAYAPLHWRMAAVGAATFANQVVMWLPLLGMFTGIISNYYMMAMFMAAAWGVIMLFNLVTLPVEFDASSRAKVILGKMGFIQPGEEADGVNKVLRAAALTYVAAFITSLAYFLYYLLPLLLGGRRSND
ncbi:MAG: peptidase [Verrucomicrobia bacterium Tous-C9LFEB]|nr:MAG: peptidase [Verrucomicrobia bacterium Tous-C9LFEB]